jgi:hypothetical protein
MKTFKKYLDDKKITPNAFADEKKCSNATVWRAYNGRPLRPANAKKFHELTEGKVPLMAFLFPQAKVDMDKL